MKKFVLGFMIGALLFGIMPIKATIEEYICYKADYKVMVSGTEYTNADLPILNYKGNTYAPFRSILEAAGLSVNWNAELGQAEVTNVDPSSQTSTVQSDQTSTGGNKMSDTTTPYRNPLMVDSSTPPETIDGLSVYTVDGVQYVAADTKKDTTSNDITGFDSKYFPNDTGYSITYVSNTFIIVTRDPSKPQTDVLSIPSDKEHLLVINGVLYIESNYYKNTVEPLVKPVEEPTN